MNSMNWVQFFGACVVVLGSIAAARFTARAAINAATTTANVAAAAVEVDREDRLIQNLERRLDAVNHEIVTLRTREEKLSRRVARCEAEREADRRIIDLLRRYARALRDTLEELGQPAPPPPDGLELD